MKLGQQLRKIRVDKGMSQQELARRLGYRTNSYVSDVEKGRFVPSADKLRRIARALRVPLPEVQGSIRDSKIDELGIKDKAFASMIRDYPRLSRMDRHLIAKTYVEIRNRKERRR